MKHNMCTAATSVSPAISIRPLSACPTCLVYGTRDTLSWFRRLLFPARSACFSGASTNPEPGALLSGPQLNRGLLRASSAPLFSGSTNKSTFGMEPVTPLHLGLPLPQPRNTRGGAGCTYREPVVGWWASLCCSTSRASSAQL
ncbi:unnamed protein product [Arctogadus glacialis]